MFYKLKNVCNMHGKHISEFWTSNGNLNCTLQAILDEVYHKLKFQRKPTQFTQANPENWTEYKVFCERKKAA